MFLEGNRRWYTRYGEQRASGSFLAVFSRPRSRELRAIVRHVRMHQLGHFMMGDMKIAADVKAIPKSEEFRQAVFDGYYRVILSGTYGNDGLPLDGNDFPGLWDRLHPVPPELVEAFWAGGGHNDAGSEGPAFWKWAGKNAAMLRKLLPVRTAGPTASTQESA